MKRKAPGGKSSPQKTPKKLSPALREDCFRVLDDSNRPKEKLDLDKSEVIDLYKAMVRTRIFDERCMMLQRQGRIGFYVPSFGQEAIQMGVASSFEPDDWFFPSYREPGVFLYRGAGLHELLCNLYGNADDISKGRQMPVHYSVAEKHMFSVSSPIATQVVQAVGAALAFKIRGEKGVAVTFFGDGATSENDFHTGLTFAAVYKAPVIFICTNNQYAISVPLHKQTGAKRLVDKAIGYGMPGIAVDGNDLFAVRQACSEAVERARRGEGPTMLECVTLRMGPHSSSDDPTRYRDEALYEFWKKRDPIARVKSFMESKKWWSEKEEQTLQEQIKKEIVTAIDKAEKVTPPELSTLFEDVYAELTPQLVEQQAELQRELDLRGKFVNTSEAFPL